MSTPWKLLEKLIAEQPWSGDEDDASQDPLLKGVSGDQGRGGPLGGVDTPKAPKSPNKVGGRFKPGGMPAKGSTFQPGGELALGAAGMRSGIEQSVQAGDLAGFVQKYAEHYDGDPEILLRQIQELDSLSSDQASMRIRSINHALGKLHAKAREDIKRRVHQQLWSQISPKHSLQDLKAFVKKAKKDKKYEMDANAREKVDRIEASIEHYRERLERAVKADPYARQLDADYSLVVGGRGAARHFGGGLSQTAKSGEKGEKQIATVKQPAFGRGEAHVEPKPQSNVSLSPKWKEKVGRAPAPPPPPEKKSKKAPEPPKVQAKGPTIRKKSKKEAIDRFADQIFEVAAANYTPRWWDDL